MLLLKGKVKSGAEPQLQGLIESFGARALDDCPETYTLELTGANDRIDEFIDKVGRCAEILAVVRSGAMAIARGPKLLKGP